MALTAKTLIACGVPADIARAHVPHMVRAMRAHGITTRPRARAFIATTLHESMGLRRMNEIGGGAKYEGKVGNTHKGDGERFKGRGPIQLTGRANYEAYGRMLGLDLVARPELVATPEVGWQVAACYFAKRSGLLKAADAGDFRRVTLLVNGGYNGWEDRKRYWDKLKTLGVVPGSPTLKRGSRGHEVEVLTRRLARVKSKKTGKPFLGGTRTKFDLATKRALTAFQREHDLKADGVLDPRSAAVLERAAKPNTVVPQATKPTSVKPHGNGTDKRVTKLWRRLEQLDGKSDRVRAQLRTVNPPVLECTEGVSDVRLVKLLQRTDVQSDALRKALAARLTQPEAAPDADDVLLDLVRQLTALSARLSEVAVECTDDEPEQVAAVAAPAAAAPAATAAPAVAPAPAPAAAPVVTTNGGSAAPSAEETIARLEELDNEADTLRAALEDALLAKSKVEDPPCGPANPETSRYLELLATLDRLDAESDEIRGALRRPVEAGKKARTFRVRSPEMKGEDIRRWQVFLNRCLRKWDVDYHVGVDGEYGKETSLWSKRVLYGLGLSVSDWKGVTPRARAKARHERTRTPAERGNARKRAEWRQQLRRRHADAPKRGKKAALAYARKHADRRTAETHTNGGPYIDDWIRAVHIQPGTAAAPWCGAFVNACLVKAGLPSRDWLRYTPSIVNNAKAGVEGWSWHSRPHVGDLVLFNWPGGDFVDHVGIVVALNGDGSVKTVEGNFKNRVDYWTRKSQILGYARPPWRR